MVSHLDLLPYLVEKRITEGTAGWIVYPDKGPEEVTFQRIHHATNRACWFLMNHLPVGVESFCWIGKSDWRYAIWMLAAIKTGKTVIFPSFKNRPKANMRLFESTKAQALIYDPEATDSLKPLLDLTREIMPIIPGLTWQEMAGTQDVEEFPFTAKLDDVRSKPFLAIHTSGTSGHPKPVYWNHDAVNSAFASMEGEEIAKKQGGKLAMRFVANSPGYLNLFPLSHAGGVFPMLFCLTQGLKYILPHPDMGFTRDNITNILDPNLVKSFFAPPSILEDLMDHPPATERLRAVGECFISGGPLNPVKGERLSKIMRHILPIWAQSESFCGQQVASGDSKHFNCIRWLDIGHRLDEIFPNMFELVLTRSGEVERRYATFKCLPDIEEYHTKDLFSPRPEPEHQGCWVYRGRADSWVALSNGLKFDATNTENIVASHPEVSGCIVAGMYHFLPCILIEMKPGYFPTTEQETQEAIHKIWPHLTEANKEAPKFGRIPKELILFATQNKPFLRAGKGTIQRQLTILEYQEEIDDTYDRVEAGLMIRDLPILDADNMDQLRLFLVRVYSEAMGRDPKSEPLDHNQDLLATGIDSQALTVVVARLRAAFRQRGLSAEQLEGVNINLLYTATTISNIANKLSSILKQSRDTNIVKDTPLSTQDDVQNLLQKYLSLAARQPSNKASKACNGPLKVVLTGSTGAFGTHILDELLSQPPEKVGRVICLNRGDNAFERQELALKKRGLRILDPDRVTFYSVDYGKPRLGLDLETWAHLERETTLIIHNAWPVNFLMTVSSFEPHLQGLADLMELARESSNRPALAFISSISSSLGSAGSTPTEEVVAPDHTAALEMGYAQSKYIGERMVDKYATSSGLPAAILRVGQIAGPIDGPGVWNRQEWFPSLIKSSLFLGAIPSKLGLVDYVNWMPIDTLAKISVEILENYLQPSILTDSNSANGSTAGVFNLLNPHLTLWSSLLPALNESIPNTVPFPEWVEMLEKSRDKGGFAMADNPGVKLINYYREIGSSSGPELSAITKNMTRFSKTALNVRPITAGNLGKWAKQW
nr:hypothetical protein BGZ63DRAFT_491818 [Mariannaea sp. PMI_226]